MISHNIDNTSVWKVIILLQVYKEPHLSSFTLNMSLVDFGGSGTSTRADCLEVSKSEMDAAVHHVIFLN